MDPLMLWTALPERKGLAEVWSGGPWRRAWPCLYAKGASYDMADCRRPCGVWRASRPCGGGVASSGTLEVDPKVGQVRMALLW